MHTTQATKIPEQALTRFFWSRALFFLDHAIFVATVFVASALWILSIWIPNPYTFGVVFAGVSLIWVWSIHTLRPYYRAVIQLQTR